MTRREAAEWVRTGAIATVLLSGGVLIGSYGPPPQPAAGTPQSRPTPAQASQPKDGPPAPAPGPAVEAVAPRMPAAPGFEPFEAGGSSSPQSFGGQYAVLRGATTVAAPVDTQPGAGSSPVAARDLAASATSITAPAPAPAAPAAARAAPVDSVNQPLNAPEPAVRRPTPAQGIPRGIALGTPLLAIVRSGGRALFHGLAVEAGPTPAGLEGEWAVIGECDRIVRVDLSMPGGRVGALRAIGRAQSTGAASGEPVVPRQACSLAGDRYVRPAPATAQDRGAYNGAGREMGFGLDELHTVARVRGGAILTFRGSAGSAVAFTAAEGGRVRVLSSYAAGPGDGEVSLIGVYRVSGAYLAWLARGPREAPTGLVVMESSDLRAWAERGPFELRQP